MLSVTCFSVLSLPLKLSEQNKSKTHLFRLEIRVRKRGGWRYSFFPQCKHDLHCRVRPLRPTTPVEIMPDFHEHVLGQYKW